MKNRTIKAGRLFIHKKTGYAPESPSFSRRCSPHAVRTTTRRTCRRGDIPLDFGVSVDHTVSRAAETTASSLSSMGVYAYYTGSSNLSTSDKPNFMCNQKVERTNSASPWTYSPVKYWYQ